MARTIWTPVAKQDLTGTVHYIAVAGGGTEIAEKIFGEILDTIDAFARGDHAGQPFDGAPADWLYASHKRWLIFFRELDDGIEIMRVIDGARDLPRRLRER